MRDVVIIDAVRTPIGRIGGALSAVRPDDLLAHVLNALMERTGVDPRVMGYGPVPATTKLLHRLGLDLADVGLVELNEAFAAQSLGVMRKLGLDHARTNVNGGAIALGHPLGCSGTRIMTTLLHEMKRRAPDTTTRYYGLATLCIGVGQGVSTVVEWIGDY